MNILKFLPILLSIILFSANSYAKETKYSCKPKSAAAVRSNGIQVFKITGKEKPVEITSKKATRYFMTVLEACHLVLQTTSIKSSGNIFILDMGKPINILQLAQNLGKIKMKLNNNYIFKYKEIGLQPGEKLKETLKDKKEEEIKELNLNHDKLKIEIETNQKKYEDLIDTAAEKISSFVEKAKQENLSQ